MGKLPISKISRIAHKLSRLLRGDDFNWNRYPEHYALEMEGSSSRWTHHFTDYQIQGGLIRPMGAAKPLHPNFQVLYQAFMELRPSSVMDVGCGWGYQLVMACRLAGADPRGFDISDQQVSKALSDWPELEGKLSVWDATKPFPSVADLVYSHAVLMHLSESRALAVLRNMIDASKGWVLLIENWERRDYRGLLSRIGDFKKRWFKRDGAKGLLIRIEQGRAQARPSVKNI